MRMSLYGSDCSFLAQEIAIAIATTAAAAAAATAAAAALPQEHESLPHLSGC